MALRVLVAGDDAERHEMAMMLTREPRAKAIARRAERVKNEGKQGATRELYDFRDYHPGEVDTSLAAAIDRFVVSLEEAKRAAKRLRKCRTIETRLDAKNAMFSAVEFYHAMQRVEKDGAA